MSMICLQHVLTRYDSSRMISSLVMAMAMVDISQVQVNLVKNVRMIFMRCWNARDGR